MRTQGRDGKYIDEPGVHRARDVRRYARALRIVLAAWTTNEKGHQTRLAEAMGYTRVHLSNALCGRRAISTRFLGAFCAATGCPRGVVEALATGAEDDGAVMRWLRA